MATLLGQYVCTVHERGAGGKILQALTARAAAAARRRAGRSTA
jgi:hypothetical protein